MPILLCDTDFVIKVTNDPIPELKSFLESMGFELATLPAVVRELKGLLRSPKKSTGRRAKLALQSVGSLIRVEEEVQSPRTEPDVQLIYFAEKSKDGFVIATMDGNLLAKLEKKRVPYLTLRKDRPFHRQFSRATYLTTKSH